MRNLLILISVLLAGCSTTNQPELGRDIVNVPKYYPPTLGWIDEAPSQYERYLMMYRQGYWDCVKKYIQDINYIPQKSDTYANGWMSEIQGYSDGYVAAEKDMASNLKRFGKARTAQYLQVVKEGGGA